MMASTEMWRALSSWGGSCSTLASMRSFVNSVHQKARKLRALLDHNDDVLR